MFALSYILTHFFFVILHSYMQRKDVIINFLLNLFFCFKKPSRIMMTLIVLNICGFVIDPEMEYFYLTCIQVGEQ